MNNSEYTHTTTANRSKTTIGVTRQEREQMILDDLRVEISRLADAVEQQNQLLEARSEGVAQEDQP